MSSNNKYLTIISKIEKIRSKNNVNWMDILRLSFTKAPQETIKIMNKINTDDAAISKLLKKLTTNFKK